ncbi:type I-G CRISPR-associated protein Cas8g1/Csx17 [Micromonospora chersina]|uniref:type I-G CRISPR-associated protein Cas8g1/Csx17 n=1 Tax=Micromonospora chersina TaxID=47854 RepID=UPI0036A8C8DE
MSAVVMPGLHPTPLVNYLAGLGLIRVIGEQADPQVIAAWTPEGLLIDTTVADIATWLAQTYAPTPVLSPWNEGSGFGTKDVTPRQALERLVSHPVPRLAAFRAALATATLVAERYRSEGWGKEQAVRELRNRCPEAMLPWLDAAIVITNGKAYYPPLLGTGGNDGRLEFSTNFHQRLIELLDPAPKAAARALAQARDLLDGEQHEKLINSPIGQFDPAGAGPPGSSPFGAASALVNPWAYVLLIEGTMLFASRANRRNQHGAGRAAMPFTVFASPNSASGAEGEETRGELWAPVWRKPFTLAEIRQLFGEARAVWRGRPAQRALDFYAATRTLGVARGIDSYERYGLHRRNGLAFVAVPLERVEVREDPTVRLAARLEDWVARVERATLSGAVQQSVRRTRTEQLAFVRESGALPLARLLASITDLEVAVARSGRARGELPVRVPPSAADFLAVLATANCPELRIAVGVASCRSGAGVGRTGQSQRSMRQILLPVDPQGRWRDTPLVPGFNIRPLRHVLADVLAWRCRTAADEPGPVPFRGSPTFRQGVPVPHADLHAFAQPGLLDDKALHLWLRACLALDWHGVAHDWPEPGDGFVPVPTLGLLHPLAAGATPPGQRLADQVPRQALDPDWANRLSMGHLTAVHAEAARRLRQMGWQVVPPTGEILGDGRAITAALVPRCRKPTDVLWRHLSRRQPRITDGAAVAQSQTDEHPAEEMA